MNAENAGFSLEKLAHDVWGPFAQRQNLRWMQKGPLVHPSLYWTELYVLFRKALYFVTMQKQPLHSSLYRKLKETIQKIFVFYEKYSQTGGSARFYISYYQSSFTVRSLNKYFINARQVYILPCSRTYMNCLACHRTIANYFLIQQLLKSLISCWKGVGGKIDNAKYIFSETHGYNYFDLGDGVGDWGYLHRSHGLGHKGQSQGAWRGHQQEVRAGGVIYYSFQDKYTPLQIGAQHRDKSTWAA